VSNFVNLGAGESDREVDIEHAVIFTERRSQIHDVDPIVLISHKVKVFQLVLNDVASLITWPFFFGDDDIIGFK
jgi:hypothetical protein